MALLNGCIVKVLNNFEVLEDGDYCRNITEVSLTYKPDGYRPLAWHLVSEEMPAWIGKQIKEYPYGELYEFCRLVKPRPTISKELK